MQITDAGMGLPEAIWANATQSRAADLEQLQDGRKNEEQEKGKEAERQICKKKGLSHPKSQSCRSTDGPISAYSATMIFYAFSCISNASASFLY